MAIILISGGSGLVGRAVSEKLLSAGHEIRILSRTPINNQNIKSYYWNVDSGEIDEKAFIGIDHLVHLAGAGIADKRWTPERKKEIIESRTKSMALIISALKQNHIKLKSFVGASAIGIYGMNTSEKVYTESDIGEDCFLTQSCIEWEKAYTEMPNFSHKNTIIRIGVVLSKKGGALQKLLPIFKSGLGSPVGSGKQYMPWIHIDDLCSIFSECLFNPNYSGVYNAVAPETVTNSVFSKELAGVLSKPYFLPNVPSFVLKLMFGEMANVLLEGSKISNQRLIEHGFSFQFEKLSSALKALLQAK